MTGKLSWDFERVAGPFTLTEGPVWDGEALLFSDINASRIMRYDPGAGRCDVYRTDTHSANGLRMDAEGRVYACEGGGRRITRYDRDGTVAVLADRFEGKRLNSPNDIAIDSQGRVWFTDPRYEGAATYDDGIGALELGHESVFRLDPAASGCGAYAIHRMTFDTTKPNGLLLSLDEKALYVAQSHYGEGNKRELRAYPIREGDPQGLGPYEVLHNFYPHRGIDGMTLDAEGNIVATAGWRQSGPGPMIYVFAPNGRVLETHPVPEDRPTNCTFGDKDLQTLYVTTIEGWLLRARTERRGVVIGGIR
jgi:gluconolactonase